MRPSRRWSPRLSQLKPLLALLCLTLAAPVAAEAPPYTDEQGEEVFGPDYTPASPRDTGARPLIGRPEAGARLPAGAQRVTDAFRAAARVAEARLDRPWLRDRLTRWRAWLARADALGVPLRRSVRALLTKEEGAEPVRFTAAPAAKPIVAPVGTMTAHFVDVGQGAGAVLEFRCGVAVIDTGGEREAGSSDRFVAYLDGFFAARPHLKRTIDVLVTSHPHRDHLDGLSALFPAGKAPRFRVRNIVDNGQTHTKGSVGAQTKAREAAIRAGARYSAVELRSQVAATGVTNAVIDPIKCRGVDPVITAFWGGRNEALAGQSPGEFARRYRNPNNHSVVVRVDFGAASFLFLGDLQRDAQADLFEEFADNLAAFDADVLLVSHHGADNGTTDDLLRIVSPEVAVISMGHREERGAGTAWDYGHPRRRTLDVLQQPPEVVTAARPPFTGWTADDQEAPFRPVEVDRAIYATGWEGTVLVTARADGSLRVDRPEAR